MDTITFTDQDQLQPIIVRPPAIAGKAYPLTLISDGDFENLIFWLYKTEIKNGSWKGEFDTIRLMQASNDKARDCSIYKDKNQCAVIQCKHSQISKALTTDMFAKEVIKFGLYSIVFPNDIKIIQGFKYYIVSSAGYNENCDKFIDNFKTEVDTNAGMEAWANTVIKNFTSLKGLKYEDVEAELKSRLKMLSIERIDGTEINRLLGLLYQSATVKAFFELKSVVDEELIIPVYTSLDSLHQKMDALLNPVKDMQPLVRPTQIQFTEPHLMRHVFTPEDEIVSKVWDIRKTLIEYIQTNDHIALLGWGLTGKTHELLRTGHILSGADYDYHVFYTKLDVYSDSDLSDFIPGLAQRPQEKIILLLDGLDEVLPEFYGQALTKIQEFTRKYAHIKLVVSCRENFYNTFSAKSKLNTLPDFASLKLMELDGDTIQKYLKEQPGLNLVDFTVKIKANDLEGLIKTPFYLIKFANKYQNTGRVLNGKSELFEELINDGIKEDIKRRYTFSRASHAQKLRKALEELSFIMELQGKNYFTQADLAEIFEDSYTVDLVKNAGSIIYGNDDENGYWRFVHHNMQEYLAAVVLSTLDLKEVKPIITRDPAGTIIKPVWIHTISFLISILPKDSDKRNEIMDMLVNNEPGLFLKFEPDKLTDEIRFAVFKKIFNNYKEQDKRLHRTKFEPSELSRFSQTEESLEYIIEVLENPGSQNQLMNALEIAAFYELRLYPALKTRFKAALSTHLNNADEFTQFLTIRAIVQLLKLTLSDFQQLFDRFKTADNTWIRFILFHAIWQQGYAADYLDFLTSEIGKLILEERISYNSREEKQRLGNEHMELVQAIKSLTTDDAISGLIDFWEMNIGPLYFSIYYRDIISFMFEEAGKLNNDEHYSKILKVFLDHTNEFYGNYRNDHLIQYFKSGGKQFEVFKALYNKKPGRNYVDMQIMVWFYDEQALLFLENEISDGAFNLQQAELFQRVIDEHNKDLVLPYNTMVNKYQTLPIPVPIDHKAIKAKIVQREAQALFDLQVFKGEIIHLYNESGENSLRFDDLHRMSQVDRVDREFRYWLFRCFQSPYGFNWAYPKDEVLEAMERLWDETWISRVYLFSKENSDWQPDEMQLKMIKDWVDTHIENIDFTQGIDHLSTGVNEESDKVILASYFIRKFELTGYKTEKYLDMLFLQRWLDTAPEIFDFVSSVVDHTLLDERVLENLYNGHINYQVLNNHIKYVLDRAIVQAAPLLISYLAKNGTYEWPNVLKAYLALGGDLQNLSGLFANLNDYHHDTLVSAFIEAKSPFIQGYLLNKLDTEPNATRKLLLAKSLIRLQNRIGLVYYYQFMQTTMTVPDISAPGNPLYYVSDISLLDVGLQIFELAYNPTLIHDSMSDLKSIATQMLQNLAFRNNNFPAFQKQVLEFIEQRKQEQITAYTESKQKMLDQLDYFFEGLQHQYYLMDEAPLSLRDAIELSKMVLK